MAIKIYGVCSTKGGVGKTTVTANLGAICADMNQRVLFIDCDPQGSLSQTFDIQHHADFGLQQLYRSANTDGCISKTTIPNLDIVINDDPSTDSTVIASFLRESVTHFHNLWIALQHVRDEYDYVFIDTQGAKGVIQESVIFCSDVLLSPLPPRVLDSRAFIDGFVELINRYKPSNGRPSVTGRPAPEVKVLINMWDRTRNASDVTKYLRTEFAKGSDGISVLNTVIPRLEIYASAIGVNEPVHRYETARSGNTPAALYLMTDLIHELEPRLGDIKASWNKKAAAKGVQA